MKLKDLHFGNYLVLALLPLVWFSGGCGGNYERENIMLDSLDAMLVKTAEYIDIDILTIQARKKEIDQNYGLIKTYYTDTVSLEMGSNMQKYKGVLKVYNLFLNEVTHCKQEMLELKKQVDNLRHDVNKGEMEKPEFRKFYDAEKLDNEINLQLAERIGKTTMEVEPEYQRLSKYVGTIMTDMRNKNPEVEQILKSNK
jgi:hypothetical protein